MTTKRKVMALLTLVAWVRNVVRCVLSFPYRCQNMLGLSSIIPCVKLLACVMSQLEERILLYSVNHIFSYQHLKLVLVGNESPCHDLQPHTQSDPLVQCVLPAFRGKALVCSVAPTPTWHHGIIFYTLLMSSI